MQIANRISPSPTARAHFVGTRGGRRSAEDQEKNLRPAQAASATRISAQSRPNATSEPQAMLKLASLARARQRQQQSPICQRKCLFRTCHESAQTSQIRRTFLNHTNRISGRLIRIDVSHGSARSSARPTRGSQPMLIDVYAQQ